MGLRYVYEIVTERQHGDRLVEAVAQHLRPDNRAMLLSTRRLGAEKAVEEFNRLDGSLLPGFGGDEMCLSFLLKPDDILREYEDSLRERTRPSSRIPVGCVWAGVRVGQAYAHLWARAATSGMSRAFQQSPSIRSTFVAIGKAAKASLVFFDQEEEDAVLALPGGRPFTPEWITDAWIGIHETLLEELDVDTYCREALRAAGRSREE
ncbi:MAG: hypothetical protein AAGI52_00745 [Bacteroidota bacterium]